jgi:rare lipoprotein A
MQIDSAQAEVESARQHLDLSLRSMYVNGRVQTLVQLLGSSDVSEFLAWYENVIAVSTHQAASFRALKEKRKRLRGIEEKLNAFKSEQAELNGSVDAAPIQATLEEKKNELASVSSTLITMELPATDAPPPASFSPSTVFARPDVNAFAPTGQIFSGYTSWYGGELHGKPTASGEVFDEDAFTCAHRTLPFGTWLKVSFRGRSVIVKVNDRGPAVKSRALDLSRGAADAIGLTGVQWVDCEIVVPIP